MIKFLFCPLRTIDINGISLKTENYKLFQHFESDDPLIPYDEPALAGRDGH